MSYGDILKITGIVRRIGWSFCCKPYCCGWVLLHTENEYRLFPDLTDPIVVVMTDAHSMAAEEVERLVTFLIETAVNGATNVRRVRSHFHARFFIRMDRV